MDGQRRQRAKRDVISLCHRGLDYLTLFREASARLNAAVPFDRTCWHTLDPATLLFTSAWSQDLPHGPAVAAQLTRHEYEIDDVIKWSYLAGRDWPVGVLRHATHGCPDLSPRFRELLRPAGIGDELRASFVTGGAGWGALGLYRDHRRNGFDDDEAALLAELSSHLADGVRRALLLDGAPASTEELGPGLVVLDAASDVEEMNAAAPALLADIVEVAGVGGPSRLPTAVCAVAAQARAAARGADTRPARGRTLTRLGRWLVLYGSMIGGSADRVAVIIEHAGPGELAAMIMSAYGLSAREREVTRLVLQGRSTDDIAAALSLSAYTVQDYLKLIFDKVGVHSRRQLTGMIFREHYQPRAWRGDRLSAEGWFAGAAQSQADRSAAARGRAASR
jgi:DNA-binding CsgD family transcriptional regulator